MKSKQTEIGRGLRAIGEMNRSQAAAAPDTGEHKLGRLARGVPKQFQKVSDNLDLRVLGTNRTSGDSRPVGRSVEELLGVAQDKDGVYGPDNKSVSEDMTVRELLDWHSDYAWSCAEEIAGEHKAPAKGDRAIGWTSGAADLAIRAEVARRGLDK